MARRPPRPRRLLLPVLLLPFLLLGGCASAPRADDAGTGEEAVVSARGFFSTLLPRPLGTVTAEGDPVVFTLGWLGMIGGGILGGVAGVLVILRYPGPGEAAWGVMAVFVTGGAVVGGTLLTLPVRGLEELWRWLFGS